MRTLRIAALALSLTFAVNAVAVEKAATLPVPVETPAPELPRGLFDREGAGFVEAILYVDEHGRVARAVSGDSSQQDLEKPVTDSMRLWRFDPGEKEGKPVKRICRMRVEFANGIASVGPVMSLHAKPDTMPKILKSVEPEYPLELLDSGNRGRVEVTFILNTRGEVLVPEVVQATHPAFETAAIAAIAQWKFAPAEVKGKAVPLYTSQGFTFDLGSPRSVDAFSIKRLPKNKMAGGIKVDTPPTPKVTVFPVHPYLEAIEGRTGTAEVKVLVGPKGTALGSLVVKASKPEFGLALAAAMEAWTFDPALLDKSPTIALVSRTHKFETRDRDSSIDSETAALAKRIRNHKFNPAKAAELDVPLKAKFRAAPAYPTALLERGIDGTSRIEVIIDKKGRAVLPRIVEASEPEFGWAAATAVQRWRFDPPTVGGKPVEVKVVVPMRFTPPKPRPDESDQREADAAAPAEG